MLYFPNNGQSWGYYVVCIFLETNSISLISGKRQGIYAAFLLDQSLKGCADEIFYSKSINQQDFFLNPAKSQYKFITSSSVFRKAYSRWDLKKLDTLILWKQVSCFVHTTQTIQYLFYLLCTYHITKGQLILKCLFGIFKSPKKRAKKFDFTTMEPQVDCFCSFFFEELKNLKEISKLIDL